jgi:hypothetical protein
VSSHVYASSVRYLAILLLALVATIASGELTHGTTTILHEGVEPGLTPIQVVTGGWPWPFLVDHPSISPVGSVSLVNAILRMDHFRAWAFLGDLAIYAALAALMEKGRRHARRPR